MGDRFAIFCGSAIAATTPEGEAFLPMVREVMTEFFAEVAVRLAAGDYYDRLSAAYGREIAAKGAT